MHDQADFARGWIRKGDSDLGTGAGVVTGDGPFDTACFHAQQAAEKYLKAVIAYTGAAIPKTHDIKVLAEICLRHFPALDLGGLDVNRLTPFAVQLRYDQEFWPDRDEATLALDIAKRVRAAVLLVLPVQAHPQDT
jgi:HEPN domain-containing protein